MSFPFFFAIFAAKAAPLANSFLQTLRPHFALMRPHQYIKNLLIFAPIFFSLQIGDLTLLADALQVFLGFSLLTSTVYILNDFKDREDDRNHPIKRNRPLASGAVSPPAAFWQLGILLVLGSVLIGLVSLQALYLAGLYLLLNLAYTFYLKHVPIIDIFIIAIGFVLRLYIGSVVGDIPLSMWIILMTFLLALFLALAKRRDDVLLSADGKRTRKAIDGYNLEFINGAMIIMASVTIVAYISYTISKEVQLFFHNEHLYYTVFFVLLGILRYLQITFVEEKSGSPTRVILRDLFLQLTFLGWVVTFIVLIY